MDVKYECFYMFEGIKESVIIPGIQPAREGFWLTRCRAYRPEEAPYYWLPPSAVLYVIRREWDTKDCTDLETLL